MGCEKGESIPIPSLNPGLQGDCLPVVLDHLKETVLVDQHEVTIQIDVSVSADHGQRDRDRKQMLAQSWIWAVAVCFFDCIVGIIHISCSLTLWRSRIWIGSGSISLNFF